MDYKNTQCPICNKMFSNDDDIVVCPDCGAPYHRSCYNLTGNCLYKDLHGTDKAYVHKQDTNNVEELLEDLKACPRCNAKNNKEAMFCESCGFIFANTQNNSAQTPPFMPGMPFIFDPMGGVNPNELIDGIPSGEIATYVRVNTPYYMSIFKKIKDKNKSKFNFSAFLFSGAWFLYRKQYKIGSIITALVFSIMITSSFFVYNYSQSLANPENPLYFLPYILSFFNMLIMIFSGFFANRIYLNHCIKVIKMIRNKNKSEVEYKKTLGEQGGVNIKVLTVLFVCYIIIEHLPRFLVK